MAENLTDLGNDALGATEDAAQGAIDNVTSQIPDVPNPADLIPEISKIPSIGGLIGSLPLPSFKKPQKIKVEKPPLPRKLQKQTKIPKIPKVDEIPDVAGDIQGAVGSATSAAQGAVGNVTNNLPI